MVLGESGRLLQKMALEPSSEGQVRLWQEAVPHRAGELGLTTHGHGVGRLRAGGTPPHMFLLSVLLGLTGTWGSGPEPSLTSPEVDPSCAPGLGYKDSWAGFSHPTCSQGPH